MKTQIRLAKLEEKAGINEPCGVCGPWDNDRREQITFLAQQDVELHQPKATDLKAGKCGGCGRAVVFDHTFIAPEDREIWNRLMTEDQASEREGRPVSREWWQAFISVFDREQAAMRAHYGEAYDRSLEKSELPRFRRWLEEQMNSAT